MSTDHRAHVELGMGGPVDRELESVAAHVLEWLCLLLLGDALDPEQG